MPMRALEAPQNLGEITPVNILQQSASTSFSDNLLHLS